MLTSTKNPRVIHLRKLQNNARLRRQEGVFVAEGIRLIEEALNAGWRPETLLYTADLADRGVNLLRSFEAQGVDVILVADHVMQAVSDTQTPQGILALLPMPGPAVAELLDFTLILDGIRDPGNMGTILRTALAAGIDTVILPPGTVDPFSPKVVRGAMGAHFHLPLCLLNWDEIESMVRSRPASCYLADSAAGKPYHQVDFRLPLVMIIGGEASGASAEALALNPERLHIPMVGPVESLNAAVAAAILIFEVVRQKSV